MTPRRLSLLLIAALGSFVAHELGYASEALVAGPDQGVGHDYLSTVASFLIPAGLGALGWVIVRGERFFVGSFRWHTVGFVAGLQAAIFLSQEFIEAAVAGDPLAAVVRPGVLVGLLLQPIVAWFLLQSATAGRHLVELIESAGAIGWQRSLGPPLAIATEVAAGFAAKECPPPRRRGPPAAVSV
jgi:hypothetical protein